jgi:hypothetical protein
MLLYLPEVSFINSPGNLSFNMNCRDSHKGPFHNQRRILFHSDISPARWMSDNEVVVTFRNRRLSHSRSVKGSSTPQTVPVCFFFIILAVDNTVRIRNAAVNNFHDVGF